MLLPKSATTLRGYTVEQFVADLIAGIIVGVVALPLAIAFAVASGVTPQRGLYTAIVAGFLISALGGSRVQIGGPTGAFVVIVFGIVQRYGIDGLLLATLMAGVILILLGLARLGSVIKFIPHPVIVGFTSGIAVIIFSSQVKDLLGLPIAVVPAAFVAKWTVFAQHLSASNSATVMVACVSLAIIAFWPRISRRIPGPFVALVAGTGLVALLHLPVETIGSRFGAFAGGFPAPALPHVTFAAMSVLIVPAFTIAFLAAIESLLSAVVADGMIGGRHRSNMELIAQGVANIASPLFGGIPATGAIARTATNVKNGGRTPVAGVIHALTLLLIMLVVGRWAALIPMATLAAILVVVAYHMSEWRSFRDLLHTPRGDVLVLLVTFLLTVFVDLTVAIGVGMVLAAFLFMKQMAGVANVTMLASGLPGARESAADPLATFPPLPPGVELYEIEGPFFFGAAEAFSNALAQVAAEPRVLIIRMRSVPVMDATGVNVLERLSRHAAQHGGRIILAEMPAQPAALVAKSGVRRRMTNITVAASLDEAFRVATTPEP